MDTEYIVAGAYGLWWMISQLGRCMGILESAQAKGICAAQENRAVFTALALIWAWVEQHNPSIYGTSRQ